MTYGLTSLVVVSAVLVVYNFGRPGQATPPDLATLFARWDGQEYRRIVENGYSFRRDTGSSVAFFPLFPSLALVPALAGLGAEWGLVAVANLAAAAAFAAAAAYFSRRWPSGDRAGQWALVALGLLPHTYFFRMAYSESLFLLLTIVVLYGLEAGWNRLGLALLVGLATAARPVGIALAIPYLVQVWQTAPSARTGLLRVLALAPLTVWGLASFMLYLAWQFGDPLAFAYSQLQWRYRPGLPPVPSDPWSHKLLALLTLEPFWVNFLPSSPWNWRREDPDAARLGPLFSAYLANPVVFGATCLLVAFGVKKRWLTTSETLTATLLLLIPYLTRSYDILMASGARFAVVVFPVYLVIGRLLACWPRRLAQALLGLSTLFLFIYTIKFAACHRYTY